MSFFHTESKIEKFGKSFKITIYIPQRKALINLLATPVNRSEELSSFVSGKISVGKSIDKRYFYLPGDETEIIEAIKKNKAYGIVDSIECGSAFAFTILQRCHCNHIEVSIPILFCFINHGLNIGNEEIGINHRQVVAVNPSLSNPVVSLCHSSCHPHE